MGKLTFKQKRFAEEYVKTNGNGTKSALRVYDTNSIKTASVIAAENLDKPSVKQELERILESEDLKLSKFTKKLGEIAATSPAKGFSGADVLEAVKTGLKLHGALTDHRQEVTLNFKKDLEKLSLQELKELLEKRWAETQNILKGETI